MTTELNKNNVGLTPFSQRLTTDLKKNSNTSRIRAYSTTSSSSLSSLSVIERNQRPISGNSIQSNNSNDLFSITRHISEHNSSDSDILLKQKNLQKQTQLMKKKTNNETILTPSQRYRLRKSKTQSTIRNISKYNDLGENYEEHPITESMLWNIPLATTSTTSFINENKNNMKKIDPISTTFDKLSGSFQQPTTMIPGVGDTTISSESKFMESTSFYLSNLYNDIEMELSKKYLTERESSADFLSFECKRLSESGLEDLRLISRDKIACTSNGRPSWLPPKSLNERKYDQILIRETMNNASTDQLSRHNRISQRIELNKKNKLATYGLLDKGLNRNSSIFSLRKIVWETPIDMSIRNKIYGDLLHMDIFIGNYIEPFQYLINVLNRSSFPNTKEFEITQLINENIKIKNDSNFNNIIKDLKMLLRLKSISQYGLTYGDELIFYHLLLESPNNKDVNSLIEIWQIENIIQLTCFNETVIDKYNSNILEPNGVFGTTLIGKEGFEDEFNASCLNFTTWWSIMQRIDHDLFMWMLDIIIVNNSQSSQKASSMFEINILERKDDKLNEGEIPWETYKEKNISSNYKILISLTLHVLLNHHFGFNNLSELARIKDDKNLCIPLPLDFMDTQEEINDIYNAFVSKWSNYYKKF